MRCAEVVSGVIHDCTEIDPQSAMAWTTIANARRLMTKDPEVEEQAVMTYKLREAQIKEAQQAKEASREHRSCDTPGGPSSRRQRGSDGKNDKDNLREKFIPDRRLSTKTKAADVLSNKCQSKPNLDISEANNAMPTINSCVTLVF